MKKTSKKRNWQKRCLEAVPKTRSDNRGYTLQTVIVMAILVASAVGASVVLYRAINSNTDVRSFTDTAGSNVPSRPHNFVVEPRIATIPVPTKRPVPSATVRWSPPLYTGFTRFEEQPVDASSASLLYEVEYGCSIPGVGVALSELELSDFERNPTDNTATADIDESELGLHTLYLDNPGVSFHNSATNEADAMLQNLFPDPMDLPDTAHCILQAKAYTCPQAPADPCANPPDPDNREEIYSLESELIRFELSRAPTEILNPEYIVPTEGMTATNNRIDLVWGTPEYTGAGEAHLYEIKWAQREDDDDPTDFNTATIPDSETRCTVGNAHSLDLTLNAELIVDIRITPYAYDATTPIPVDTAVPPNFTCPSSDDLIAGEPTDWHGIELVVNGSVPDDDLPTLTITEVLPSSQRLQTANDADKRTYLQNRFVNLQAGITLEVPKTTSYNLENYELRWSRADGTGTSNSRVITDLGTPTEFIPPPPPTPPLLHERYSSSVILNLAYEKAYNFTLIANFDNGEARISNNCAVITHSKRTPTPEVVVAPRSDTELIVRIAPDRKSVV